MFMFRRYGFTLVFTLIALALCLFNASGYDPHNLVFFALSIPVWITELVADIHTVPVGFMYALTIVSWMLIGRFTDWWLHRKEPEAEV